MKVIIVRNQGITGFTGLEATIPHPPRQEQYLNELLHLTGSTADLAAAVSQPRELKGYNARPADFPGPEHLLEYAAETNAQVYVLADAKTLLGFPGGEYLVRIAPDCRWADDNGAGYWRAT